VQDIFNYKCSIIGELTTLELQLLSDYLQGVDNRDVKMVIMYGVCASLSELAQRLGRCVRDLITTGLFILMYEPWVLSEKIPIATINDDPDTPIHPISKPNPKKRERTSWAMFELVQLGVCIRSFLAEYLNDDTQLGMCVIIFCITSNTILALSFTGPWCCNRHNNEFDLQSLVPGPIFSGVDTAITQAIKRKRRITNRPVDERMALASILHTWQLTKHSKDHLAPVRPLFYILSDYSINKLAKLPMSKDISPASITEALDETLEWSKEFADEICLAIRDFDSAMATVKSKKIDLANINSTGDIAQLLGGDYVSTSNVVKAIHLVIRQKKENAQRNQTRRAAKSAKENNTNENICEEGNSESSADDEPMSKRNRVLVLSDILNVV
jgi:hypothetical protein